MKYLILVFLLLSPAALFAVEPDETLQDLALEIRAREVSKELRCVVCQNQDIDSSNAGVARDLRILVRKRLVAGDSNAQVKDYVQARYGDYVLMRPPFKAQTVALWLAPPILGFIAGLTGWFVLSGARNKRPITALSASEEAEVDAFIKSQEKQCDA